MDCPRCGDKNGAADRFCSTCGQDLETYRKLWPTPPAPAATGSQGETADLAPGMADSQGTLAATEASHIPSYLGWAAVLLAICWPAFWAGIPAVVYASRVETLEAAGDVAGAHEASKKAKDWCWATFLGGLAMWMVALGLIATF